MIALGLCYKRARVRQMQLRAATYRFAFLALAAVTLAACGSGGTKETYVEKPAEDIYNGAMDKLVAMDYKGAAKDFDEVERQHPYSVWATKAELMGAYASYEGNKYDDAVGAADRFIQLHPGHRDVAYAYYLKALSYYVQIVDVGRDQRITDKAMKALDEVVRRFPDSKYARDARLKLDLTRDHLAGKEMDIGRYYERQGQYVAAINRFRRVVDNFQTTSHVPEALHRLTECYLALGVTDEAQKTAAVLGYNYPGSDWYKDSYALVTGGPSNVAAPEKGWFGRVIGALF
jgi:outer membrane protein assembly factor BamD